MVSLINSKIFVPFINKKCSSAKKTFWIPEDYNQRFKELYETHHRQIFNLCFNVTLDEDVAENITAKVFVQLYKELKGFGHEVDISAYLRRLAATDLLNHLHPQVQI